MTDGGSPRAFHLLAKPSSSVCNIECEYYFYLEKEAEELARRRAPAGVMAWSRRRDEAQLSRAMEKAGRNDPCPCGSGKKVKRCHGEAGT